MSTGDWIITLSGALLAAAALAILVWSLLADGLRTRPARRAGTLRRCPRCWYDMSAVAGLRCPECGRGFRQERACRRLRVRWASAAASVLLLLVGATGSVYPFCKDGAWRRRLPDTAIIVLITYADDGWALKEMARRLQLLQGSAQPAIPHRLWGWQWRLLADACLDAGKDPVRPDVDLAWQIPMWCGPPVAATLNTAIEHVERSDGVAHLASMLLDARLHQLTTAQLERARNALLAEDNSASYQRVMGILKSGTRYGPGNFSLALIDAEIAARADPVYQTQLAAAQTVALTPSALAEDLGQCSWAQLAIIYERLGLPLERFRHSFDSLTYRNIWIRNRSLHLDDDNVPDALLWIDRTGSTFEAIGFLRRGNEWRCIGRLSFSDKIEPKGVVFEGRRWLVINQEGPRRSRSDLDSTDLWYRCDGERLELMQCVPVGVCAPPLGQSFLQRSLQVTSPELVNVNGRTIVRYAATGAAELRLPLPPNGDTWRGVVWSAAPTIDYPLDPDPTLHGAPVVAATWGGRPLTWILECSDAELLDQSEDSIRGHLRDGDARLRQAIRLYLGTPERSPDLQRLRDALADDY